MKALREDMINSSPRRTLFACVRGVRACLCAQGVIGAVGRPMTCNTCVMKACECVRHGTRDDTQCMLPVWASGVGMQGVTQTGMVVEEREGGGGRAGGRAEGPVKPMPEAETGQHHLNHHHHQQAKKCAKKHSRCTSQWYTHTHRQT